MRELPIGWFAVAFSAALPDQAVVPIEALGQHLVAWRDAHGVAHVMDAYCPHLGAHVGVGGQVVDDTLHRSNFLLAAETELARA